MYCTKCGTKSDEDHKFCADCGAPLMAPETAPNPEVASSAILNPTTPLSTPTAATAQTRWDPTWNAAPARTKEPGKIFLLVTGILYIVFGAFIALAMIGLLTSTDEWLWEYGGEAMRGAWNIYYTAELFHGFFWIFIGIMGIVNRINRKRADLLLCLGIADIVILVSMYIIAALLGVLSYNIDSLSLLPFYLILPVLYIVGAARKRAVGKETPHG